MGYQLTGGEGEETYEFPMKFKNGYATVMVWFYHRVRFIYPYCIFLFDSQHRIVLRSDFIFHKKENEYGCLVEG